MKMFSDDLYHTPILSRPDVKLCKPIQVGFAILDLSKRHMYDGYYNTWLQHFPKSRLLFTDMDSFCVAVEHPDVYGEMENFQDWFDFSEYPRDHPLFNERNRKIVGKFKDELNGACMYIFIGLRPKLYSFNDLDLNGEIRGKNTAKVVQEVMNKRQTCADYEQCLSNMDTKSISTRSIRSDPHKLHTYSIQKITHVLNYSPKS